jgi:prepilin-type N-terminal cleavage/methylation domain-containing protein
MKRRTERGFTLLELMVTVVILSILATVAVFSYKRYAQQARTQEAINFLYEIKMKQETYYQAYGQYVTAGLNPLILPSEANDKGDAIPWEIDCESGSTTELQWCDLGPKANFNVCSWGTGQCTSFRFATVGWAPGAVAPGSVTIASQAIDPVIRDSSRRWWYAYAEGDLDLDTEFSGWLLTSENNQVIDVWNGSRL